MQLFYRTARQWPASEMPQHLQSPHLIGFISRACPKVLFDESTTTVRLTPMIARADALDGSLSQALERCICCKSILQSPGKTRTCHGCSLDLKLVMVVVKCQVCQQNFERRFSDYAFRLKRKMKEVYCSKDCTYSGAHLRAVPRCKNCAHCNKPTRKAQLKYCNQKCYLAAKTLRTK